jgi:hypothetical protein
MAYEPMSSVVGHEGLVNEWLEFHKRSGSGGQPFDVAWQESQKQGDVMTAANISLVRGVPIMSATCLFAALMSVASAQGDTRVGTWELNLGQSTFNPGPPPKRQTLTYGATARGLWALLQGIDAAGKPINPDTSNTAINFDGKDHPTAQARPQANYDSSAWTRISANKYVVNRKKAGKVVLTSTNVVSNDGKTMTITTKGVDEDGRPINNVRVYDKQ